MKKLIIVVVVCVVICSFLFYKASKDTYMIERTYSCKVMSKLDNNYSSHTKSGTHYSRDFILVLESEGKKFSLDVDPTTWAICKEGDTLLFKIAPYQLDYCGAPTIRIGAARSMVGFCMAHDKSHNHDNPFQCIAHLRSLVEEQQVK